MVVLRFAIRYSSRIRRFGRLSQQACVHCAGSAQWLHTHQPERRFSPRRLYFAVRLRREVTHNLMLFISLFLSLSIPVVLPGSVTCLPLPLLYCQVRKPCANRSQPRFFVPVSTQTAPDPESSEPPSSPHPTDRKSTRLNSSHGYISY